MIKGSELVRHPLAIAGVIITTTSAVVFIALVIAMLIGMLDNPYAGLIVFVALPALFLLGLLLIPIGVRLERRALQTDPTASVEWPVIDLRRADVRRNTLLIVALTGVNIVIVLLAGYGGLHWMESPAFCGQVCHTTMHPQFIAWQNASHANIPCVKCHIGEGAAGFVHAKLSGVRQLVHVWTGRVPKPVPPGALMPPGAQQQLCLGCHQPDRIVADRISVIREYADDETNSETTTFLQMYIGTASRSGRSIHWHANPAVRIEYVATDDKHQTIPYVRVTDANGQVKEYVAPDTKEDAISAGQRETMDCMDCHNTVGHPIAPTPEKAVDGAIAAGRVSRKLPFARREAVRLMTAHASDDDAAAIERDLRKFYESQHGAADQQDLTRTVAALQELHRTNVFPAMKVTWGSYPNNKGHITSDGCFRCHDGSHAAKDGSTINSDCEYCHKMIEQPS
ncbi:MAG TPA: NapC/NirT family cytochrome c [Vicinamibacterales bacterium]|nr:NapC/NirT family cytochrome c [Vicinamibacterales bacterium]